MQRHRPKLGSIEPNSISIKSISKNIPFTINVRHLKAHVRNYIKAFCPCKQPTPGDIKTLRKYEVPYTMN